MAQSEIIPPETRERTEDDLYAAALHDLAQAEYRLELAQKDWHSAGAPVLAIGSQGQAIEHPLMKIQRDLEQHVVKLREVVKRKHRGPDPSAVLNGGGVPKSRSARLRAVKDASE